MTAAEEEIAFYSEIGRAITEWAEVENTLRYAVLACFEKKDDEDLTHRSLSVGFFSIDGFRAKMDFAEGVVNRRFQQHHEDWSRLVQRTRRASSHRNKLAHWSVKEYPESIPGRRLMLIPWVFPKPKRRSKKPLPPSGSQGLRDIRKMRLEFRALSVALENFCYRLQGYRAPHAKDREQPENPPPIPTLRVQILGGLERPLLPSEEKREKKNR